ncbi:helix-turn-helix domain-containing protein [bacterium]|nr:helix-turn-helix domain-containing protein [bacterium]
MAVHARPMYAVPSVKRSVRILFLLAEHRTLMSLKEISEHLAIPKTTALRILRTLAREGMVETRDGKFHVGPRLIQLSGRVLEAGALRAFGPPGADQPEAALLRPTFHAFPAAPEKGSGAL